MRDVCVCVCVCVCVNEREREREGERERKRCLEQSGMVRDGTGKDYIKQAMVL